MEDRTAQPSANEYIFPDPNEKFHTKGLVIGAANVGSLGKEGETTASNRIVRKNVISFLSRVQNRYGKVHGLFLQEVNNYQTKFPPIFNTKPSETDEEVTYGKDAGGRRGVANWTIAQEGYRAQDKAKLESLPKDVKNEIATSILRYRGRKGKSVPVAILNLYRNIHDRFERTVQETKVAVKQIMIKLNNMGIRNVVLLGDFNSENIKFDNLKRISHPDLFHKANERTARRYIDQVHTNMLNVGFLDVFPALENVHGSGLNMKNSVLGHKSYCLWIGVKPTKADKQLTKITPRPRLKLEAKEYNGYPEIPKLRILDANEADQYCDEEEIDVLANPIIEIMRVIWRM